MSETSCAKCGAAIPDSGAGDAFANVCAACIVKEAIEIDPAEGGAGGSGAEAPPHSPTPPGAPSLDPGARVGRYEIVRFIAEGGMGAVYLARDPAVPRTVALKLIRRGRDDDPRVSARFHREVRAAAQLAHPNVVRLHDVGEEPAFWWYTMEFIDGPSLARVLKDTRPLPPRTAMRVARDVAHGLAHAHEKGVVHRDIKPGNILLVPESEVVDRAPTDSALAVPRGFVAEYRAVLTDFGLAREVKGGTVLTLSGDALGTPMYMSPEQAAGQSHLADARSDVYSLGAVLYEMVTGLPPATGKTTLEVLEAVKKEEPIAPRKLLPRLSRDAETIVLKALSKERERRYATASAFADDIERYLRGEAVKARPLGWTYRTRRRVSKNPWAWVGMPIATFVVFAALATIVGLWTQHSKKTTLQMQRDQAAAYYDLHGRPAAEAAIELALLGNTAQAEPLIGVMETASVEARKIDTTFCGDLRDRARLHHALGRTDEAWAATNELLLVRPDDPWAKMIRASLLAEQYFSRVQGLLLDKAASDTAGFLRPEGLSMWLDPGSLAEIESSNPELRALRQQADVDMNQAVQSLGHPGTIELRTQWAAVCAANGRREEALRAIENLATPGALMLRAEMALLVEDLDNAEALFSRVVESTPHGGRAWIGRAWARFGKASSALSENNLAGVAAVIHEAVSDFAHASGLAPDNEGVLRMLMFLGIMSAALESQQTGTISLSGDLSVASDAAEQILSRNPQDRPALAMRCFILILDAARLVGQGEWPTGPLPQLREAVAEFLSLPPNARWLSPGGQVGGMMFHGPSGLHLTGELATSEDVAAVVAFFLYAMGNYLATRESWCQQVAHLAPGSDPGSTGPPGMAAFIGTACLIAAEKSDPSADARESLFTQAVRWWDVEVSVEGTSAMAWAWKGAVELAAAKGIGAGGEKGRALMEKAGRSFERAVAIDPRLSVYLETIRELAAEEVEAEAGPRTYEDVLRLIERYTRKVEANPQDLVALINRGVSRTRIVQVRPNDRLECAQALEGAIADFSSVIERDPQNVLAFTLRGAAQSNLATYKLGDDTRALRLRGIADLERALSLDPSDQEAWAFLGATQFNLAGETTAHGEMAELLQRAVAAFTRARAVEGDGRVSYASIRSWRQRALQGLQLHGEKLAGAEAALDAWSGDPAELETLVRQLVESGAQAGVDQPASTPRRQEADELSRARRFDEAFAVYARALAAEPDDLWGWNNYAWYLATYTWAADGDPAVPAPGERSQRAVECARRAVGLATTPRDRALVADTLAAALFTNGEIDEAIAAQEEALAATPEDQRAGMSARLEAYRRFAGDR